VISMRTRHGPKLGDSPYRIKTGSSECTASLMARIKDNQVNTAESPTSAAAKIRQHREDLEDLADSDLPCAEIAAILLEASEEA